MDVRDSEVRMLKDESGDLAKLVRMGITEAEILTYIVRAHEDRSRDQALNALLAGRSFTHEKLDFVKIVLNRFSL